MSAGSQGAARAAGERVAVWPSQAADASTRAVLSWVTGAPGRQEAWLCLYVFVAGRGRTCLAL